MDNINKNFSDIKDAFSILEGQDKLVHLIDLGKKIDKIDIEDKNIYRIEANLYNEYTREWDWFYKKEWTSNDINEIKNEGNYEIE